MSSILAITPARDEERLLPQLIDSMVAQKVPPARWVIIDDGSTDETGALADQAATKHAWIRVVHLPRTRVRAEGGESVTAQVLQQERWRDYDFLLRLDSDLSFDADLTSLLTDEFARDSGLGIAGPILLEEDASGWHPIRQPEFHTRGAAKMYARACLLATGLPDAGLGWDTLDELRAMMAGYRTRHFLHIRARHHRPQGAAGGTWKARTAAGIAAYRIGYSPVFVLARAVRLVFAASGPVGALALLNGFLRGYRERLPRPASPELIAFVRRNQLRRLFLQESLWR